MALIETNFIRPQEVYDRNTGKSKVRYRSYDGNDRFIPVMEGENGVPKTLVEVAHAELKAMRDAGKLTPGALYRITDYNCTTTQENTRSAGHQFDIVLLALSANKLAEEGWAMMNESNVYDVTYTPDVGQEPVTAKGYLYNYLSPEEPEYSIVLCDTLKGSSGLDGSEFTIDEENKTIVFNSDFYASMNVENLTYNYFQNSNLNAWKVWYSLDNDKSRFAWADDSVDEGSPANITYNSKKGEVEAIRNSTLDGEYNGTMYYGWTEEGADVRYTTSETPSIGDTIYNGSHQTFQTVLTFTPAHEGTGLPNGRGVIYRLIDEWNNDVPYDFKNILYLRKVTNGDIDAQGTDTYIPTFCLYDIGNDEYKDASIFAIEYPDDEGKTRPCNNIFIGSILAIDRSIDSGIYALPQNIILAKVEKDDTGWGSRDVTLVNVSMCNLTNSTSHVIYLSSSNKTYVGDNNTIISQGKRVVWENIS